MSDRAVLRSLFDEVPASELGSVSVRVVVLPPVQKKSKGEVAPKQTELSDLDDLEDFDDPLSDEGANPLGSYLETGRGAKYCCVFLINGQRHDALDKSFILRELGFKYLASRMMILVDLDGLSNDAMRSLIKGDRQGLYKGEIWDAILARIVRTLKSDPELDRLEREAEEKVAELQAGDSKVRKALDELIEAHHDRGLRVIEGSAVPGANDSEDPGFKTVRKGNVVTLIRTGKGGDASLPALIARPTAFQLVPNQAKRLLVTSKPADAWAALATKVLDKGAPIDGLTITEESTADGLKLKLLFRPPEGFDRKQYPLSGKIAVSARFHGFSEWRRIEIGFLITPDEDEQEPELFDEPTFLKVTSRSPVLLWKVPDNADPKIKRRHGDTHVRIKWDGNDHLIAGPMPTWRLSARIVSPSRTSQPTLTFSSPHNGRFTLLVAPLPEWKVGQQFTFDVTATRDDGRKLVASFIGEVGEPTPETEPKPRLVEAGMPIGANRRAPYDLRYIYRREYEEVPCWDGKWWSDADPGCYQPPTERTPLVLIINNNMALLEDYRETLVKKQKSEGFIERQITKYSSHVAYHLYQMYQAASSKPAEEDATAAEERRRDEIRRMAMTLIRLMD